MKNPHVVLKHLDNSIRILSFSIHDLVAYLAPFFVGSFFDSLFVVPVGGLLGVFVLKRLLKRLPRFYLLRFLYWNLPTGRRACFLKSSKRYWVG